MTEFVSLKTSRLSADRDLQRAIDLINEKIRNGTLVYIYELDNRNYSIKLRNPIGISMADFAEIVDK